MNKLIFIAMLFLASSGLAAEVISVKPMDLEGSAQVILTEVTQPKLAQTVKNEFTIIFHDIWNYTLFTLEKEPVKVSNIVMAMVLLTVAMKVARRLARLTRDKFFKRLDLTPTTLAAFEKLALYIYICVAMIIVLDLANFPLTIFTYIGGALALGVGLGSQNIVNNLISGLIILFDQPIRVGDIIELNPTTIGKVITIGARCTQIRTNNNIDILIPNSKMLESMLTNWTLSDNIHTVKSTFKVNLNADTYKVEKIFKEVLAACPRVLKEPAVQIFFMSFNEEGYLYEVYYSVDMTKQDRREVMTEVNHKIVDTFRKNNIAILPPMRIITQSEFEEA